MRALRTPRSTWRRLTMPRLPRMPTRRCTDGFPMKKPKKRSNGFSWPNDARIAVVVTCLLENWSEGKGPPFSVQTTALKPGTHDRAAMTWGTYGVRAGVWRLLKILDENKVPATFAANAHSLELNPTATKQIVASGHEISAHSYLQDSILAYLTPDEERALIRKTKDIVRAVTGE